MEDEEVATNALILPLFFSLYRQELFLPSLRLQDLS